MFDTTKSCYGCPYRCSGRNEHCPYECNGCHGKCFGYECRVAEDNKRNQERRDSLAWISDTERERRVNVISSQKSNRKRR